MRSRPRPVLARRLVSQGYLFDFDGDFDRAANKNFPDAGRRVGPVRLRGSDHCIDARTLWDIGPSAS